MFLHNDFSSQTRAGVDLSTLGTPQSHSI